MTTQTVIASAPKGRKGRATKSAAMASAAPNAVEVLVAKKSAMLVKAETFARADFELQQGKDATRLEMLLAAIEGYGKISQHDFKTWLRPGFVKGYPEGYKASNISALAPGIVAASHGFKPNPGEGFGPFRERALAWLRTQPDTVYKVQEKTKTDPAPGGESEAPEGKTRGRAGADHDKATVWNREDVIKWLSGGDSDTTWALESVLAYARDAAFLTAMDSVVEAAEKRATRPGRRATK